MLPPASRFLDTSSSSNSTAIEQKKVLFRFYKITRMLNPFYEYLSKPMPDPDMYEISTELWQVANKKVRCNWKLYSNGYVFEQKT